MVTENSDINNIPDKLLEQLRGLSERELHVVAHLVNRKHVSRDADKGFREQLTIGERIADRVASFGGSWPFILIFLTLMMVWILFNQGGSRRFDPYPFILLNLVLSCLAALQAPIIMMSQNRHAARDRVAAQLDYEVNLKAELEILSLHTKLDELKERQWTELNVLQERQLAMLGQIQAGTSPGFR